MKTIKFLLTATVVAIVAIATAVERPKMSVVPLTPDRAVVSVQNDNAALIELSIETQKGDLVYYKKSAKPLSDYQKVFDFENLENGAYVIYLKINDTRLSKEFVVTSKEISVGDSKLRFDPYFTFEDEVLKFSFLNFENDNYKMSIYENNNLLFQDKLGKDLALTNGYDLSGLPGGNYRVVLSSFKNDFVYDLVK